jgi:hypothetical protein
MAVWSSIDATFSSTSFLFNREWWKKVAADSITSTGCRNIFTLGRKESVAKGG